MKRLLFVTLFLSVILAACAVQPAQPTPTPTLVSTATSLPTVTSTFPPISTLTADQIAAWNAILDKVVSSVGQTDGVNEVHRAALDGHLLTISLQTKWTNPNLQPQVSYQIVRQLSWFCSEDMRQQILAATGVLSPSIRLITESSDGNYVFLSLTSFQQCYSVSVGDLSFKSWQSQSGLVQAN